jgi:hypothetical protein
MSNKRDFLKFINLYKLVLHILPVNFCQYFSLLNARLWGDVWKSSTSAWLSLTRFFFLAIFSCLVYHLFIGFVSLEFFGVKQICTYVWVNLLIRYVWKLGNLEMCTYLFSYLDVHKFPRNCTFSFSFVI